MADLRAGLLGMAFAAAGLVGGCSDGIEVNSKLFDAIGVTGSVTKAEPKMSERPGLVVPPPMASLPEPGSGKQVRDAVAAQLPLDPERAAKLKVAEQKKLQQQACADAKQRHDDEGVAQNCPGLFSILFGGTKSDEDQ
jgi:hypothetical protein